MVKETLAENENKTRIVPSDLSCLQPWGGLFSGGVQEASINDLTSMDTEVNNTQEEFRGAKNTLPVPFAC